MLSEVEFNTQTTVITKVMKAAIALNDWSHSTPGKPDVHNYVENVSNRTGAMRNDDDDGDGDDDGGDEVTRLRMACKQVIVGNSCDPSMFVWTKDDRDE